MAPTAPIFSEPATRSRSSQFCSIRGRLIRWRARPPVARGCGRSGTGTRRPRTARLYLAAALRCLSASALRDYWGAAVGRGDLDDASGALAGAESVLGPAGDLPDKRALLEDLRSHGESGTPDRTA